MHTQRAWMSLVMATLAFTVSFLAWSLMSPLASQWQKAYGISDVAISFIIAVPVILGSLARIAMGMLTDRFGGRRMMTALLLFTILPLLGMTTATSVGGFVFWGFLLGVAGSSFAIGVPFVSRWFSPEKQGLVVGIFGMGNIGTAISARFAPQIASTSGWQMAFFLCALLILGMAIAFYLLSRDAERQAGKVQTLGQQLAVLKREKMAWAFSLWYFATFGGFVAFSLYLPKLLVDQFGLDKIDAGNRVAVFVIVATLSRPFGGWLADRIAGSRLLVVVFVGLPLLALTLAFQPPMLVLTICFLLMAMLFGLGSGVIFKLVPQHFPKDAGTVTGLVGAAGGLGGFFPPLIMGFFKASVGSFAPGYVLLAGATVCCLALVWLVFRPSRQSPLLGETSSTPRLSEEMDKEEVR